MHFEAVPEFLSMYQGLSDPELGEVGALLTRLESEHASRWSRQGRIRGDHDAWIIIESNWRLYWTYQSESTILPLALIRRDNLR